MSVTRLPDNYLRPIEQFLWGTYGPPADFDTYPNRQPKLKWMRLMDCTTEHLRNILKTEGKRLRERQLHAIYGLLLERQLEGY